MSSNILCRPVPHENTCVTNQAELLPCYQYNLTGSPLLFLCFCSQLCCLKVASSQMFHSISPHSFLIPSPIAHDNCPWSSHDLQHVLLGGQIQLKNCLHLPSPSTWLTGWHETQQSLYCVQCSPLFYYMRKENVLRGISRDVLQYLKRSIKSCRIISRRTGGHVTFAPGMTLELSAIMSPSG